MSTFTEHELRELRRRLGMNGGTGRLAQSFGTQSHSHAETDVSGLTAALATKAGLADSNNFTGAQNVFETAHANVAFATDGTVAIEEGVISGTLLTGAQTYSLPDASGTFMLTDTVHAHTATDLSGVTKTPGSYSATAQTGSIGAQTLTTGAGALYRVSVYVVASASAVGVLTVTVAWNDGVSAQSENVIAAAAIAANGMVHASAEVYAASGNVTVATTLVSGTMTYNIYTVAERMT